MRVNKVSKVDRRHNESHHHLYHYHQIRTIHIKIESYARKPSDNTSAAPTTCNK